MRPQKMKIYLAGIVFVVAIAAPGCQGGQGESIATDFDNENVSTDTDATASDAEIERAVERELRADPAVRPQQVDIDSRDGTVTLSGTVGSLLERRHAVERTGMVRGVRAIDDELEVTDLNIPDDQLQSSVETALLRDPATDLYDVDATAQDGIVTLAGDVDSWQAKQLAEEVAAGVRGVRDIENDIALHLEAVRPDEEILQDVEGRIAGDPWLDADALHVNVEDGHVTVDGAVASVAALHRAREAAWVAGTESVDVSAIRIEPWRSLPDQREAPRESDVLTDDEIASSILLVFDQDPRVKDFDVDVSVDDGDVTLAGEVDNLAAKAAAEQDARNTSGVEEVHSEITVRFPLQFSNEELADHVRAAFFDNPYVNSHDIEVRVVDGHLYLKGLVDSSFERDEAERVARQVNGVAMITNRIRVWKSHERLTEDWAIEGDIGSLIFWDTRIANTSDVHVSVDGRIARLFGTVRTNYAVQAAIEDAYMGGAHDVIDDLVVYHR